MSILWRHRFEDRIDLRLQAFTWMLWTWNTLFGQTIHLLQFYEGLNGPNLLRISGESKVLIDSTSYWIYAKNNLISVYKTDQTFGLLSREISSLLKNKCKMFSSNNKYLLQMLQTSLNTSLPFKINLFTWK